MARDRPSPYGEGWCVYRSAGALGCQTRIREGFPRDLIVTMCVSASVVCDRLITNRSGSGDPDLQSLAHARWRGTGPRPTVKGWCFYRSRRDILVPIRTATKRIETRRSRLLGASRPGGLAYWGHRDPEVSPTERWVDIHRGFVVSYKL